jgi:hypothetical protein
MYFNLDLHLIFRSTSLLSIRSPLHSGQAVSFVFLRSRVRIWASTSSSQALFSVAPWRATKLSDDLGRLFDFLFRDTAYNGDIHYNKKYVQLTFYKVTIQWVL